MSHLLIEFDLAGAEWVVVAYLAGDANMLGVVASGKSPHVVTGALISKASEEFVLEEYKAVGSHTDPDTIASLRKNLEIPRGIFLPRSLSIRQAGKKSNHGCNYYMRYRRFALENGMPETDAEPIVAFYSQVAYPGLNDYWEGIKGELRSNKRALTNCFGRKATLMGEWGVDLFMAAYAFKPQSTVFDVCRAGMIRAYNDESPEFQNARLGAQVHDSLMIGYPLPQTKDDWYDLCRVLDRMTREHMISELHYKGAVDGVERDFKLSSDAKLGISWGTMHGVKVTQDYDALILQVQEALSLSQDPLAAVAESEWLATAHLDQGLPLTSQDPPLEVS